MHDGVPRLFDRHSLALHRERARRIGGGDLFLLREALQGISERLSAVNRRFGDALAIDMPLVPFEKGQDPAQHWDFVTLDASEALPLENERFDLAVSSLSLHAVNDLPGVLFQIREKLAPNGLFLAALFGGETLFELRDSFAAAEIATTGGISPRVAPFSDVRDLGGLLQRAGFALPVADVERTTVLYRDFETLVRDLRVHGETNALVERSRAPLSRATLAALLSHYRARHAESDGRLRATFDIVYLTGWAPHESQQKPLKPGAARSRLAEALGTVERPADEKAG
jgi:SAM-dependent methyltransferase